MASLYLNAICMGFLSLANCDAAICMGFKVVPLKTHANTSNSCNQVLKTHAKCSNISAQGEEYRSKAVKTHMPAHRILPPKGAEHTTILAPGRPSDKNNVPHAPAQLRLARSHGTHGTKRKRRRNEADLPVTGGRINRTSSP